jgi:hypothetical protein
MMKKEDQWWMEEEMIKKDEMIFERWIEKREGELWKWKRLLLL